MSKFQTKFLSAAALSALLFFAGGLSGIDSPVFSAGKAIAGNNGDNGNGNGGKSENAGNSGNKGNSGNAGKSANAGAGGNNSNAGGGGTVLTAIGNLLNRGQAKKAEMSATSHGIGAVASSKMKPKEFYAEYGIHPSDLPGGWMGALMGNMKLKASENSVHGRAQAALTAYEAIAATAGNYQAALAALVADPDLALLDPASPTYDQDVATLTATKIGALDDAVALLDMTSPTYDDDKATLEAEKAQWQAVLDTQSAVQTAQSNFEQAFEDVTHGQTSYSEPLAGQVMMIYQDKIDELTAANGG